MLELLRSYLGYCLNCKRPGWVGEFSLFGWRHVFPMCETCLTALGKKVNDSSIGMLEEERK